MQGIKARITKGAAWLTATRALVNLISLANTLLLARLLIPADFGLVAVATTISAIVSSVTDLSLASALVQHENPQDEHFHSAWSLNVARGVFLALIITGLAVPVARLYGDMRLVAILMVIGATTLVGATANPKLVLFSRELIFWQEFTLGVVQKVIGFTVALIIALLYRSYWALVAGMVATQVSATMLSYFLIPFRPRLRLSHVRELLSFSIWLSLSQAINTLNWKFDNLLIGYFLGSGPLGYYTVGDSLAVMPTREATTPLAQTLFPGFSRLTGDPPRLRHAYQRAQSFLSAIGLPAGFGFAIVAKPLILLILGTRWLPAVIVIQLLAGIFAIQTLSSTVQPLALAMGKTRDLLIRDTIILIIRLPLIIVGMAAGGLVGIVVARCVSGLMGTLINMAMVYRLIALPLRMQFAVNIRSLLSVIAMIFGTSFFDLVMTDSGGKLHLISKIVVMATVGATIYLTATYSMWRIAGRPPGPEKEAIQMASNIIGILRNWRVCEPPARG
jgi:O-antigen/teichoic acid export membrane protein